MLGLVLVHGTLLLQSKPPVCAGLCARAKVGIADEGAAGSEFRV